MLDNSKYRKLDDDETETMSRPVRPAQPVQRTQPARTAQAAPSKQPAPAKQPVRTAPAPNPQAAAAYGNPNSNIMEANVDQKRQQVQRASAVRGHAGRGTSRSKKQLIIYGVIIAVEVIVEIALVLFIILGGNSGKASSSKGNAATAQQSNTVDVENNNFSLRCTKVSITQDTDGNPAMLVHFTFTNKTANPLSMSNVFEPSASQNMTTLSKDVTLAEETTEMFNKDTQVSNGESIDCAYAFELSDTVSPLTLTMRDNYETFSDIGSTVVNLQ